MLTVTYATGAVTRWHVGEPVPDARCAVSVQADCDELALLLRLLPHVDTGEPSQTLSGGAAARDALAALRASQEPAADVWAGRSGGG